VLISIRKSYYELSIGTKIGDFERRNRVMALMLRYFTEFGSFRDALRNSC